MKKFILALSFVAATTCDQLMHSVILSLIYVTKHIVATFVSDGQQYRALLLNAEETAESTLLFLVKQPTAIAACSGTSDGNLIFNIYDKEQKPAVFKP